MSPKTLQPAIGNLYEQDFALWTAETVRLIRAGRFNELDVENLAEEIESMGRSDKREIRSRLRVLLAHLLKWQMQPEKRSASWESTIDVQRVEVLDVLRDSPSLRAGLRDSVAEVYSDSVKQARRETGLPAAVFPAACPFSTEQILNDSFLPK